MAMEKTIFFAPLISPCVDFSPVMTIIFDINFNMKISQKYRITFSTNFNNIFPYSA